MNKLCKKIDKNGVTTEKISKKTDNELTYKQLSNEKLSKLKKIIYLSQVSSLKCHSSQATVLGTTPEIGPIYHMDFSENLSQMHKFEPQSLHFSKAQY